MKKFFDSIIVFGLLTLSLSGCSAESAPGGSVYKEALDKSGIVYSDYDESMSSVDDTLLVFVSVAVDDVSESGLKELNNLFADLDEGTGEAVIVEFSDPGDDSDVSLTVRYPNDAGFVDGVIETFSAYSALGGVESFKGSVVGDYGVDGLVTFNFWLGEGFSLQDLYAFVEVPKEYWFEVHTALRFTGYSEVGGETMSNSFSVSFSHDYHDVVLEGEQKSCVLNTGFAWWEWLEQNSVQDTELNVELGGALEGAGQNGLSVSGVTEQGREALEGLNTCGAPFEFS